MYLRIMTTGYQTTLQINAKLLGLYSHLDIIQWVDKMEAKHGVHVDVIV